MDVHDLCTSFEGPLIYKQDLDDLYIFYSVRSDLQGVVVLSRGVPGVCRDVVL